MGDPGQSGVQESNPPAAIDPDRLIESLRVRGAERFDPVRFRFIEALAWRSASCRSNARHLLAARLATAVGDYRERFELAADTGRDGRARLERPGCGTPLTGLLAHIARHAADDAAGTVVECQAELKSVTYFRSTWSRLSVDRQLSDAFAQAPENAGPLNSHFLVLQSLRLLRDISPGYVEQFISYVDALLWLDQAESTRGAGKKNVVRGDRDGKRKPGRGKAG